jgi:hypothetical protein
VEAGSCVTVGAGVAAGRGASVGAGSPVGAAGPQAERTMTSKTSTKNVFFMNTSCTEDAIIPHLFPSCSLAHLPVSSFSIGLLFFHIIL